MKVLGQEVAEAGLEPYNQGEIVYMDCPFCRHAIAATWQSFVTNSDEVGRPISQFPSQISTQVQRDDKPVSVWVNVHWLKCQNCQEIVIRILRGESGKTDIWIALPHKPNLPVVPSLVTDPFRKDYLEAWSILEDSPRMSAVLSRRLLADLLEKYAGLKQWSLAERIEAFSADTRYPHWLRQNLHYIKEAGDFGAHKQEDKTIPTTPAQQPPEFPIISVTKEEAEWTLKNIADLFNYFIVDPEKDKAMRASLDKKIADANRKPVSPVTT